MENRDNKSVVVGAGIIIIGALFLLKNLNLFEFNIFRYVFNWYSWLIFAGVVMLTKRQNEKRKENTAYVLIGVGTIFLLSDIGLIPHVSMKILWPIILIGVGIYYILRATQSDFLPKSPNGGGNGGFSSFDTEKSEIKGVNSDLDYITDTNIFSGGKNYVESQNFKGGNLQSIFGGGEYNLTRAKLSPTTTNVLDITVLFGGIELIVPPDWIIKSDVTAVFGGFNNNKHRVIGSESEDKSKILYVRGIVLFGGGEVKSY